MTYVYRAHCYDNIWLWKWRPVDAGLDPAAWGTVFSEQEVFDSIRVDARGRGVTAEIKDLSTVRPEEEEA